ncbi:MAG: chemotaxis protein CheD [Defluviitaleaceae bacterium]|nr:chemotaxis protein CheD [Defluviitaleaceae bacterium]
MSSKMIIVGMADLNVCKSPGVLTTLGLGSCIGIAFHDNVHKIAGLAHIMLPDSKQIQNNSNVAKFADTAIVKMLQDMGRMGAQRQNIRAKIAGGAQMFAFTSTSPSMRIGDRNIEACVNILNMLRIPILANETGKTYGRTVELYADTGDFIIKTIGHGTFTV